MQVDLFDLYKNKEQSRRFIWHAIMNAMNAVGSGMQDLPHDPESDKYPVEVCLLINGKEFALEPFFDMLLSNIDITLESGMKEFAEKKAAKLLTVLNNLTQSLTQEISELAPEHYSED